MDPIDPLMPELPAGNLSGWGEGRICSWANDKVFREKTGSETLR